VELLSSAPLALAPGAKIFVCENPSIVAAAADQLGARCAPLVCTEGVPSTAVLHLLRQLSAQGARLRFHADFDWGGLRIGNILSSQLPRATPWRFGTSDYASAAENGAALLDLVGTPLHASWDEALEGEMIRRRVAIHEEHLVESLLDDLDCA
jgi:uncharacterized protein (TIGR02679 family)